MKQTMLSEIDEIFQRFQNIYQSRYTGTSTDKDLPAIGYFCTYFPAEIIHAAKMLAVRITGGNQELVHVESHIPSFACSFVRSSLELSLNGSLDHMEGVVFSHTCDTIQVLSDIWQNIFPNIFVDDIVFPTRLDAPASSVYLADELRRFAESLERYFGGSLSHEKLWNSIALFSESRRLLTELYNWRRQHPNILEAEKVFHAVNSAACMDREEHNRSMKKLLSKLTSLNSAEDDSGGSVKIFLIGNVCHSSEFVGLIEDCNCIIVDDDLCTGSRSFLSFMEDKEILDRSSDPFDYLAKTYINKSPCPSKFNRRSSRVEVMLNRIQKSQAQGVIFLLLRLCDSHYSDYTHLNKAIKAKGYPTLVIEYEQQTRSFQQLKTRVEAFSEIIRGY